MMANDGDELVAPENETPPPPNRQSATRLGNLLIICGVLLFLGTTGYIIYSSYFNSNDLTADQPRPVLLTYRVEAAPSLLVPPEQEPTLPAAAPTIGTTPAATTLAVTSPAEPAPPALPTATTRPGQPTPAPTPFAGFYPVRLTISRLEMNAPVVVVNQDSDGLIWAPEQQAGFFAGSSKLGKGGNTVIVGHVYRGRVFNRLTGARVGDEIVVEDETGQLYHFVVEELILIPIEGASAAQLESNLQYVLPTTDERLTLVTCWPETTFTHRLVLIARPMADDGSVPEES